MHQNQLYFTPPIHFKLRFNTTHGTTNLFWRIFINEEEYLAATLTCNVPTRSDAGFDEKAGAIKYNIAGTCTEFYIDENNNAFFK